MTKQLTLYQQAQAVHQDLMIQEQVVAQSLTQIAIDLKEIRDRRLYAELGYSDFAEYCENATKTGKRQAYNLISLTWKNKNGEEMQSNRIKKFYEPSPAQTVSQAPASSQAGVFTPGKF